MRWAALVLLVGILPMLAYGEPVDLTTYHLPMVPVDPLFSYRTNYTTLPHRNWWPQGVRREEIIATMVSSYSSVHTNEERIKSKKDSLKISIESLRGQVDRLNIFLDGYTTVPAFLLGESWISIESSAQYGHLGEWGKILWAHTFPLTRGILTLASNNF